MTNLSPTISRRLRRSLPAALIAAGAMLGTSALGDPGIAGAAPEWDIGEYDECMAGDILRGKTEEAHCCDMSGGVWNADAQKCVAPPRDAQVRTILDGLPKQTLTPTLATAAPGVITQRFTPAP